MFLIEAGVFQQARKRLAQLPQISWTSGAQCDARQDALYVADAAQQGLQRIGRAAGNHRVDSLVAALQYLRIAQRSLDPAPQQPAAHRALASVHDPGQGMLVVTCQ